ncbi:MAG: hypothetical protein FWH26_02230 [Oscillospiraceae bacterium]|nr:hypothetical protein [Oscillospiraceae bacterium]
MSMPRITIPASVTEENALANIIASIALEEAALAHIINAEGEKIQRVVGTFTPEGAAEPLELLVPATAEDMQAINTAVGEMMETVSSIETSLHNKLRTVLAVLEIPEAAGP